MTAESGDSGRFDIASVAAGLPDHADTMLADVYLTDRPDGSARVFRVYTPVPPHFHRGCDEYLYVFAGRGTFWIGSEEAAASFAPGQLICFARGTVHAIPELHEEPVVFVSIDAPRRDPADVVFVNAADGSPQGFMARNKDL